MKVKLFDFDLPRSLIAQRPLSPRDVSKLLLVPDNATAGTSDHLVRELPQLLRRGDMLVFNDTRVVPSRIPGRINGAKVEATLHKRTDCGVWRAFVRPAKKFKPGALVNFASDIKARIIAKGEGGEVTLDFAIDDETLMAALQRYGAMPLPPYIKRDDLADEQDKDDYQTMFAKKDGAVAAPTASLHFTPELMASLQERGIGHVFLTLHVGAGTFLPVKVETTKDHVMHSEYGIISGQTVEAINRARANGGRVVAVGSTSLRLLETAADDDGTLRSFNGETDIFITPGYRFKVVDMLLSNFHLPRSTLFMLVAAFVGMERIKQVYKHAKSNGYRFYSYGDCCLLEKGEGV